MHKVILICGALAAAMLVTANGPARSQDKGSSIGWSETLPAGLDPHAVLDVPMQFVLLNGYDGLYRYRGNPPDLIPWLAESHTVSGDGTTWTFKLRDTIKFHDGSPLEAKDVVYSFTRLLGMNKSPAGAFKTVLKAENVTAIDRLTVKFVLNAPYAPFLSAVPLVAIVNSTLVKAHTKADDWGAEWLASNDAGSGAYVMDPQTYRPQEIVNLARFTDHFMGWSDNPRPIDIVHASTIQETSTRVLALLRGDIDATDSYLPTDQVQRVEKAKGVRVARDESMRVMVIRMNNSKPPFDNVNFRRCVSHAFNYDAFIGGVLKNLAVRNAGPIPNNLWGAPKDLVAYNYDLSLAKELCAKAKQEGAPIDRPLEIHTQSQLDQTLQVSQLLQSDLHKVGVTLKIVPDQWANLSTVTGKADTSPDMWVHWVSSYFVDPENWIGQMYDSQFQGTWKASSWYRNPKVDELLRIARTEMDQEKRRRLYEDTSRIVVGDAVDIWIYNTIQLRGLSDRIAGYSFSPVGSGGEVRLLSTKD